MSDLIVGRKQIMVVLKYENWNSVEKLILKGCPIGKVEGRWIALREKLIAWIECHLENGSVQSCIRLNKITHLNSDKYLRWRRIKMESFLAYYSSGSGIRKSCRNSGISSVTFYKWRKKYERFDIACKEIERGNQDEKRYNSENIEENAEEKTA